MKMRFFRCISISAVLLLLCAASYGKSGGHPGFFRVFTFGIEGNYIGTAASYRHFNFVSSYGYRVDQRFWRTGYHSNGEFLIHAGFNVSRRVNMSFYTGYSGISRMEHTYPLTLRATYYFSGEEMERKWFAFADAGPGFYKSSDRMVMSGIFKLGGGYRIPLSLCSSLDFMVSVRNVMTNTSVPDFNTGTQFFISGDNLRRNNAVYLSFVFGIGLTF